MKSNIGQRYRIFFFSRNSLILTTFWKKSTEWVKILFFFFFTGLFFFFSPFWIWVSEWILNFSWEKKKHNMWLKFVGKTPCIFFFHQKWKKKQKSWKSSEWVAVNYSGEKKKYDTFGKSFVKNFPKSQTWNRILFP